MSDYPNGHRPDAGSGAAAVAAVIVIALLLLGGLALGGFFYFRVQQKTMLAREAAMRAEAIAHQQRAEAERAEAERAEAEMAEAVAELAVEVEAHQQAEQVRMAAEAAKTEAIEAREELEQLKTELERLKSETNAVVTTEPETVGDASTELQVHLSAEGGVYINQEPKDWDQVSAILEELQTGGRARIVIVADKDCRMAPVLRLMQLAKRRDLAVTVSTREFNSTN